MSNPDEIIQEVLDNNPSPLFSSKIEVHDLKYVKSQCPPLVDRSLNCIHEHLYDPNLDVAFLKEKCMVNGNNLSGLFKYYTGITPKKYINIHRVYASKLLLNKKELRQVAILIIALSVGYRNPSTYLKAFKRIEKTTPAQWRKKYFNK